MSLQVPRGQQGFRGRTPTFEVGNVTYAENAGEPKVTATNLGNDDAPRVKLDFVLPDVPTVTVDPEVTIVNSAAEASVIDVDPDKYNAKLHFYIPKGEKGDKGDEGSRFVIKAIYATEAEMREADANNEIPPETYIIIRSDISQVENARLWYKEENGDLTFLGDFSGATGTASRVAIDDEVIELKANQHPAVSSDIEYIGEEDVNETAVQFSIPKAASAKIAEVTKETVNSNVAADATLTDLGYVEETNTDNYSIHFKIPRGAGARITQATASAVASTVAPSATVDDLGYTAATDSNDFRLNITVPAGKSAIAEPAVIDLPPQAIPTITVGAVEYYATYTDSAGNDLTDVYVTPFTLGIPKGTVPEFDIGTAEVVYDVEDFEASITYPIDPDTGEEDKSQPRLNFGIPIGLTPIISTSAEYIAASEPPEAIVSYPIDPDTGEQDKEHPSILFKIPSGQDGQDAEFAGITEDGEGTVVKSIDRNENTHELTVNKDYIIDDDIDAENFAKAADIQQAIYDAIENIITVSPDEPEFDIAKI